MTLAAWQSIVVPKGVVHLTRAIGRTVDVTFEKRGARTVFVQPSRSGSSAPDPLLDPA